MPETTKLPPDTRAAWEALQDLPEMHGFVLIGGTALTLRLGHRISEDLDFAYHGKKLPRRRVLRIVQRMAERGQSMDPHPNPLDEEEFLDAGLELADYHQDYVVNAAVKVTFVTLDPPANQVLAGGSNDGLRIASLDEIFALKSLVCAERSKTRDWFDLHYLMSGHGFTIDDFYHVFLRCDARAKFDNAQHRLRSGRPQLGDEGYAYLLERAPSLDEIRSFFAEQLDGLEIRLAKRALSARHPDDDA